MTSDSSVLKYWFITSIAWLISRYYIIIQDHKFLIYKYFDNYLSIILLISNNSFQNHSMNDKVH